MEPVLVPVQAAVRVVAVAQAAEEGVGICFCSIKQLSFVSKDLVLLLLLFHSAGN